MRNAAILTIFSLFVALALAVHGGSPAPDAVIAGSRGNAPGGTFDRTINTSNQKLISDGRQIFRYDTFGDEAFWGDTLKLHQAIAGAKNGGVGGGVSPKTALSVGLKVDMDALPPAVVQGVSNGSISLDDPATTLPLLQL